MGVITPEGKRLMIDLLYGLDQVMTSDEVSAMSEGELRVLGTYLAKVMAEAISAKISKKLQLQSSFDAMSDEEFEAYLKEKYGSVWNLVTLTKEEYQRVPVLSQEKIEELLRKGAESVKHMPCNGVRFKS